MWLYQKKIKGDKPADSFWEDNVFISLFLKWEESAIDFIYLNFSTARDMALYESCASGEDELAQVKRTPGRCSGQSPVPTPLLHGLTVRADSVQHKKPEIRGTDLLLLQAALGRIAQEVSSLLPQCGRAPADGMGEADWGNALPTSRAPAPCQLR